MAEPVTTMQSGFRKKVRKKLSVKNSASQKRVGSKIQLLNLGGAYTRSAVSSAISGTQQGRLWRGIHYRGASSKSRVSKEMAESFEDMDESDKVYYTAVAEAIDINENNVVDDVMESLNEKGFTNLPRTTLDALTDDLAESWISEVFGHEDTSVGEYVSDMFDSALKKASTTAKKDPSAKVEFHGVTMDFDTFREFIRQVTYEIIFQVRQERESGWDVKSYIFWDGAETHKIVTENAANMRKGVNEAIERNLSVLIHDSGMFTVDEATGRKGVYDVSEEARKRWEAWEEGRKSLPKSRRRPTATSIARYYANLADNTSVPYQRRNTAKYIQDWAYWGKHD